MPHPLLILVYLYQPRQGTHINNKITMVTGYAHYLTRGKGKKLKNF